MPACPPPILTDVVVQMLPKVRKGRRLGPSMELSHFPVRIPIRLTRGLIAPTSGPQRPPFPLPYGRRCG
jgi:hypothetical protein